MSKYLVKKVNVEYYEVNAKNKNSISLENIEPHIQEETSEISIVQPRGFDFSEQLNRMTNLKKICDGIIAKKEKTKKDEGRDYIWQSNYYYRENRDIKTSAWYIDDFFNSKILITKYMILDGFSRQNVPERRLYIYVVFTNEKPEDAKEWYDLDIPVS